ncbi:unnamed protein product [Malus baccata var. baccata]
MSYMIRTLIQAVELWILGDDVGDFSLKHTKTSVFKMCAKLDVGLVISELSHDFRYPIEVNKMVQEINRREQQILGGVFVKNLRQLVKARIDEQIRGTLVRFSDTAPGPGTKKSVKIEKTRMGLRVYGRGANRNKLVVHTMYPPANRSNPPKEKVPLDKTLSQRFLGFSNGIHRFASWKKVGVLLLLLASAATAFGWWRGDET